MDALVAQVQRARGEGALLQQTQAQLLPAGGEVRLAATDRDRIDPDAELIDQVEQRGGERRPADLDVALVLARKTRHLGGRVGAAHEPHSLRAHRIIREYRDYLRLLDDLGWAVHDARPCFPLSMPAVALGRTLAQLAEHDEAVGAVCDALLDRLP